MDLKNIKFSISKKNHIFTYNLYSSSLCRVEFEQEENRFILQENPKRDYKNFQTLSFLANSDFSFETIEITKNIPDEEIEEAIFNIIYEELDNSINYQIMFDEVKSVDEKSEYRKFDVFIINPNVVKYISTIIKESVKYIDKIFPLPILFKSLYQFSGNFDTIDAFIYTYRDGTSLNIFIKGELVYSKSLNFSTLLFFEIFNEKYNLIFDEQLDYLKFQQIITDIDYLNQNVIYKKILTETLKIFFDEVEDVLSYAKRNFNIDNFDNIYYYYSKFGRVLGVDEYSRVFIGENSFSGFLNEFEIDFPQDLDEIHYLLYLTYKLYNFKNLYLDLLKPPPSFFLRESGKLISLTVASTILALIYPAYNYFQMQEIEKKILQKRKKVNLYRDEYNYKESIFKDLNNQKKKLEKKFKKVEKKYLQKLNLLKSIHEHKNSYIPKSSEIANLTYQLNQFGVMTSSILYINEKDDNYFELELLAKYEASITSLLNSLIKVYHIQTNEIKFDPKLSLYYSKLKIIDKK